MPSKKVLVLSFVHGGGEWLATKRLIEDTTITSKSFSFFLVALQGGFESSLDFFKKVISVAPANPRSPFGFFKRIIFEILNTKKALRHIVKEAGHIDCILVTHFLMVFPVFLVKELKGTKIIFFFHGTKSIPVKRLSEIDHRKIVLNILERLSLSFSSLILVPSTFAKKFVISMMSPFPKRPRVIIIPNFASGEFYKKTSFDTLDKFRDKLKIPKSAKIILSCGRIAKYKGLERLVTAFIEVLKLEKDVYLIFAYPETSSDKVVLEDIKIQLKEAGAASKVLFLEDLKSSELARIYKIAHVLVLASEIEMAPLVIVEALASQTPFISTDVGNVKEIITRIDQNLLLTSGNSEEILAKLNYTFSLSKKKLQEIKTMESEVAKDYSRGRATKKFTQILSASSM